MNLHGKILKTFLLRLLGYTALLIVWLGGVVAVHWVVIYYNIPTTLITPVFIFIGCASVAVSFLWYDTKQRVLQEHQDNNNPKAKR